MNFFLPLQIAAALLLVGGGDPAQAQTEELTIIQNGEAVGSIRAESEGRTVIVDYLVDSNGRGPRHRETIVLGSGAVPVAWSIAGRSLMGAAVAENYRWDNGRASWSSQADKGAVVATDPPLYIVNDGSPYALGVYARALLADPDRSLDVLPGGTLSIEPVRDMVLREGARTLPVTVYRIQGIDLAPDYLMLDGDKRLVATFGGGGAAIRKGWEGEVPKIVELAETLGTERARQLQQRLAHRFEGPVRIRNVRIFDPRTLALTAPSTVVVMLERISQVLPGIETGPAPAGQTVIEGEGGTLVPGLHDMHAHNRISSGLFYLAAGVTSTRDMGNDNEMLLDLIPRIEAGEIAGPRIVRNGFIEGRSDFSARHGKIAASLEEALEAVRWYADRGYWQIKIYNSMNPDWVQAIAAEAHRRGLGVTGHIPAFTSPEAMIRAGYDEIAHLNQLMLGWLIQPGEDTRTPLRLTAMARAAELDLASPEVRRTIALMKQEETAVDTTAVILERLMLSRAGTVAAGDVAYLAHMPIGYQRYRRRTFVPLASPAEDQAYRDAFERLLATVHLLHESGIRLLPGTDDSTGFTVQRELELYQQAGIPPAEVLRIATLGMEEYLERADDLGTVEQGKLADFFLIPGDPTESVSEIRRVRAVFRGGTLYFPSEIYEALGIRPFVAPPMVVPAQGEAS